MNRRTLLKTVGASVSLPTIAGQATAESEEQRPVYYTISVPKIDTQILHISIPEEMLNESNYLWSVSESKEVALNISREITDDPWGLINLAVQTDELEKVSVGGVEARRWATLQKEKVALLVLGDASHSYLGVVGDGDPISVEGVENNWKWDSVDYERVRVETTAAGDISVRSVVDDTVVPVFSMTPSYFSYNP